MALKFNRITVKPRQMGGTPCVRGLRIPVATVLSMIADGMTEVGIFGGASGSQLATFMRH
jgi:uncharacterized protein (DUF433 family)